MAPGCDEMPAWLACVPQLAGQQEGQSKAQLKPERKDLSLLLTAVRPLSETKEPQAATENVGGSTVVCGVVRGLTACRL